MDDVLDADTSSTIVCLLTGDDAARASVAGSRIIDQAAWRTLLDRDFSAKVEVEVGPRSRYRELATSRLIAFGPDDESGQAGREPVSPPQSSSRANSTPPPSTSQLPPEP